MASRSTGLHAGHVFAGIVCLVLLAPLLWSLLLRNVEAPEDELPGPGPGPELIRAQEVPEDEFGASLPEQLVAPRDSAPVGVEPGAILATLQLPQGVQSEDLLMLSEGLAPGSAAGLRTGLPELLGELLGLRLEGLRLDGPISLLLLDPQLHTKPFVLLAEIESHETLSRAARAAGKRLQVEAGWALVGEAVVVERAAAYAFAPGFATPDHSELVLFPAAVSSHAGMLAELAGLDMQEVESLGYAELLGLLAEHSERWVVSVANTRGATHIFARFHARAGTQLAAFAAAQHPASHELLTRLPVRNAQYVISGRVEIGELDAKWFSGLAQSMGAQLGTGGQLRTWLRLLLEGFDGRVAASGIGSRGAGLVGVGDADTLRELASEFGAQTRHGFSADGRVIGFLDGEGEEVEQTLAQILGEGVGDQLPQRLERALDTSRRLAESLFVWVPLADADFVLAMGAREGVLSLHGSIGYPERAALGPPFIPLGPEWEVPVPGTRAPVRAQDYQSHGTEGTRDAAAAAAFARGYGFEHEQRYGDAIAAYEQALELDPNYAQAAYRLACAHSLVGSPGLASQAFTRAYELGLSDYPAVHFDEELGQVRSEAEFPARLAEIRRRYLALEQPFAGTPVVFEPSGEAPAQGWPAIFLLHGHGDTNESYFEEARAWAAMGFLAVALPGPIPLLGAGFSWAQQEIEPTDAALRQTLAHALLRDRVDARRVYLLGFSQGAMHAFQLAARAPASYAGFIALSPGGSPFELYAQELPAAKGARGWFVSGEREGMEDFIADLDEQLGEAGWEIETSTHPGAHHFPGNWEQTRAKIGKQLAAE